MIIIFSLKQLRKDYQYINSTYGMPYDITGGYQTDEALFDILEGRSSREQVYCDLIEYYFSTGYDDGSYKRELPVDNDVKLQKIKERYYID